MSWRHSWRISKTIKQTDPLSNLCYWRIVKGKDVPEHTMKACRGKRGRAPLNVKLGIYLCTVCSLTKISFLAHCWLFTKMSCLWIVIYLWRYVICALVVVYEDMLLVHCWLFMKICYLCIVGYLWRYVTCALLAIYENILFVHWWLFMKICYLCMVGYLWKYVICALVVINEDMLFVRCWLFLKICFCALVVINESILYASTPRTELVSTHDFPRRRSNFLRNFEQSQ